MNLTWSLRGHEFSVTALCPIPSRNELLSGDESGLCILWSLDLRRAKFKFRASTTSILSITLLLLSLKYFCIQSRENVVSVYEMGEDGAVEHVGEPLLQIPAESLHFCQCKSRENVLLFCLPSSPRIGKLQFRDDGPGQDKQLTFLDLVDGKGACICLEFLDDDVVVAGYEDGSVYLHSTLSTTPLERKHEQAVLCVGVSSHSIVSAGADSTLLIHSHSGTLKQSINLASPGVSSISVFEGEIGVCGWSGDISLYSYDGKRVGDVFREHRKALRCSAGALVKSRSWTLDSKQVKAMFIGSEDCRISCWKVS